MFGFVRSMFGGQTPSPLSHSDEASSKGKEELGGEDTTVSGIAKRTLNSCPLGAKCNIKALEHYEKMDHTEEFNFSENKGQSIKEIFTNNHAAIFCSIFGIYRVPQGFEIKEGYFCEKDQFILEIKNNTQLVNNSGIKMDKGHFGEQVKDKTEPMERYILERLDHLKNSSQPDLAKNLAEKLIELHLTKSKRNLGLLFSRATFEKIVSYNK